MASEVRAPVFPESVTEGTIMAWYKQPGESVEPDEKLADIETDKIVLEVAALDAGVLEMVVKQEGETVSSGEVIGILAAGDGRAPAAKLPATIEREPPSAPAPAQPSTPPPTSVSPPEDEEPQIQGASPSARKLIMDHGLNPAAITGSGRGGRITKSDVVEYIDQVAHGQPDEDEDQELTRVPPAAAPTIASPPPAAAPAPATSPAPATPPVPSPAPSDAGERMEERVPMTRIRARIAERLVQAQQSAAILTTFNEVDMKPVMDLRARYKAEFEKKHGVKLGFMPFFVKASVEALKRFPVVNASVDESDIIYHGYYDIGIAVSSPRGLVVPVLRNADHLSFAEVESVVRDFGTRAQDNKLGLDELVGGTFTISNGGVFGSMLSTPILNPPQSAILGMHNIVERPVAVDGEVVVHPVMYLALSYDHRLVDGREAVQFLVTVKEMLEDPARLLLEV